MGAQSLVLYKTNDLSITHVEIALLQVTQVSVNNKNCSVSVATKDTNVIFRLFDLDEAQEWRKWVHFNVNKAKTQKNGAAKHSNMLGTTSARASVPTHLTREVKKAAVVRRKSIAVRKSIDRATLTGLPSASRPASDRLLPKHLQMLGAEASSPDR